MRSKCLLPLTILLSAGLLSACVPGPATDLRSQTWRVVSSNGEAGQMTFNMSTVAYTANEFSGEYILTPETQDTRDALGELTLAPTEE